MLMKGWREPGSARVCKAEKPLPPAVVLVPGLWGQKRGSQGTRLLGLEDLDEGLRAPGLGPASRGLEEDGSFGGNSWWGHSKTRNETRPNTWVPSSFVVETCVSPRALLSRGSPQQLCSPPPAGLGPRGEGETRREQQEPFAHLAQGPGPWPSTMPFWPFCCLSFWNPGI